MCTAVADMGVCLIMENGNVDLSHFRGGNPHLPPPLPFCNNRQTNTLEYISKRDSGRGWRATCRLFGKACLPIPRNTCERESCNIDTQGTESGRRWMRNQHRSSEDWRRRSSGQKPASIRRLGTGDVQNTPVARRTPA
ncbi:hypothetical protein E2C01_046580 [Portunus trituberculatus]|uniref:Uncharacterized protein n=1 Tax=Portunus trituberculatus TaxID=210409 RepID=A0A5B7G849_PORTR|nr:hypothetical protein [Portunus trituberculatus]